MAKKKICLVPGQVDRLAHDAYMMGKHGRTADTCDTVAGIVEKATTEEERIGTYHKKKKDKDFDLSAVAHKTIIRKAKKALDGWF